MNIQLPAPSGTIHLVSIISTGRMSVEAYYCMIKYDYPKIYSQFKESMCLAAIYCRAVTQ